MFSFIFFIFFHFLLLFFLLHFITLFCLDLFLRFLFFQACLNLNLRSYICLDNRSNLNNISWICDICLWCGSFFSFIYCRIILLKCFSWLSLRSLIIPVIKFCSFNLESSKLLVIGTFCFFISLFLLINL